MCGVGEGVTNRLKLRREVIHRLYISSLSHSELMKHFRVSVPACPSYIHSSSHSIGVLPVMELIFVTSP